MFVLRSPSKQPLLDRLALTDYVALHCDALCCVVTTASDVSRDGRRSVNASSRRCRRGTIGDRGSVFQPFANRR